MMTTALTLKEPGTPDADMSWIHSMANNVNRLATLNRQHLM
jgi:hypothetical protein